MEQGDTHGALRAARNTLGQARSSRAFAIMAKAYCRQKDLGMSKAMLRNLRGTERRRVRAYCAQQGISIR